MGDEASAAMAGLDKLESFLKRAVERRDLVTDNKEQLRELLGIHDNAMQELEELRKARLHDIDGVNTTIRRRLEEHKDSLLANRQQLQQLQQNVERSHFLKNRVRRHRNLLEQCNAVVRSYRHFYDSTLLPSLERYADIERERKRRKKNLVINTAQETTLKTTNLAPDSYVARRNVPPNPPRLTLDYGTTNTYEGKLKAEILSSLHAGSRIVGVVALGLGGVGKTCALRGLADDKKIVETFPGGILYTQLGNDSHLSDLITGISKSVEGTGGVQLARNIRTLEKVEEAAEAAGRWFAGHRCLFLVDDVWEVNGITAYELRKLGCMLNDVSLLVYTSRATGFEEGVDKTVKFREREAHGALAQSMLINHADIGCYDDLSYANREAVEGILEICQGLPLALGIAGATARRYCEEGAKKQNAWSEYYRDLRLKEEKIATGKTKLYGSLWPVVGRSLEVLDSRSGIKRKFKEKFCGFCVFQKQKRIDGKVLQKLWSVDSLRGARKITEMFESVSLVRMVRMSGNQFCVRVHDLVIDIADEMASKNEKMCWFGTLLDNYVNKNERTTPGTGKQAEEKIGSFPAWWEVADDGFIHSNLCRMLKGAGRWREVVWLLERARWIVMRLQNDGIRGVEQDLDIGLRTTRTQLSNDTELVMYLRIVGSAARMSHGAVFENAYEAWFQIYGRMALHAQRSERTRGLLSEIEKHAPRPWVKPSVGMLDAAGGRHSETVRIEGGLGPIFDICHGGDFIRVLRQDLDDMYSITEYNKKYGTKTALELTSVPGRRERFISDQSVSRSPFSTSIKPSHACGKFSDDMRKVVTVSRQDEVELWEVSSGRKVHCYVEKRGAIHKVGISGNGQFVVYVLEDGRLFLWDANKEIESGNPLEVLRFTVKVVQNIDVSCDGNRILCCGFSQFQSQPNSFFVWCVWEKNHNGKLAFPLEMQEDSVTCIAMSRDGRRLVSGSDDGTIRIWDTDIVGMGVRTMTGHNGRITNLVIRAEGDRVISGATDTTVRVWDAEKAVTTGNPLKMKWAEPMAMSADCREIVGSVSGNEIRVFSMETFHVSDLPECGTERVECVAYCGDGKNIVSGSSDGCVRLWDAESGFIIGQPLEGHTERVTRVAVSADGSCIASASCDRTVRVWDSTSRQAVAQRRLSEHICDLAVSNDRTRVVYSYQGRKVKLWHLPCGRVRTVTRMADWSACVAMSADGGRFAFASPHSAVVVWDVHTRRSHQITIPPHVDSEFTMGGVRSASFSADGTRLVSSSHDYTVRMWNAASGQAIGEPFRHDHPVRHVQSDKQGSHFVSYDIRGHGRLWDVDRHQCVMNSTHPEWTPTIHHLGLPDFSLGPVDFGPSTIMIRNDPGVNMILATTDRELFRVGDLYFSRTHGPHMLCSCHIIW